MGVGTGGSSPEARVIARRPTDREYPELEKDDVFQAVRYGAWLAREHISLRG